MLDQIVLLAVGKCSCGRALRRHNGEKQAEMMTLRVLQDEVSGVENTRTEKVQLCE